MERIDYNEMSIVTTKEKGYQLVWMTFLLLVFTILASQVYLYYVTTLNFNAAQEAMKSGIYYTQITVDTQIFNWAITAESVAFAAVSASQLHKKAMNNLWEYLEILLDKWANKYGIEYVSTIMQTLINNYQNIKGG